MGRLGDRSRGGDPGIGDQNINAAIFARRERKHVANRSLVGHVREEAADAVRRVGSSKCGLDLLQPGRISIGDNDTCALAQKALGTSATNATRTARDECNAALECLRLWHATQLRVLQLPVLNREGLLLGESD